MIEPEKIQRVQRLLATGQYSQRTIAHLAGVGRATVSQIARGSLDDRIASMNYDELEPHPVEPERPYVRCPTCGGRVWMPCVLCQLQARRERDRRRARLKALLATPDGQREIVDPIAARRQRVDWPKRYEATAVDPTKGFTGPGGNFPGPRDDESPRRSPQPDPRQPAPGHSARVLD